MSTTQETATARGQYTNSDFIGMLHFCSQCLRRFYVLAVLSLAKSRATTQATQTHSAP